jgi:hypothetical protein
MDYDDWMDQDLSQRRTRRSRRDRPDRFTELEPPGDVEEYMPWVGGPPHIPRASGRDWDYPRHVEELVEPPEEKRFTVTFAWTILWYALPILGYAGWTRTLSNAPGRSCAHPLHNGCPPVRAAALDTLMHSLPEISLALAIALLVAMVVRMASSAWRPITVAFAASVIGAGVATILFSVVGG